MTAVVPLQAGEKLKQGDLMQKYDGKLYPVVDWEGRTAQGSLYYREYSDIVPVGHCCGTGGGKEVVVIDDPLCRPLEPHVYYRLAEERDIGKPAWFSYTPCTQEYLLANAPKGLAKLAKVDNTFHRDGNTKILGAPFAYVREEVKRFEIVQVTKKQEFRLADEDHLGSNCYFTDSIVDPEEVREGWENDVVQGEYCERLVEINYNKKGIYADSDGNHWRFAWVPAE